MSQEHTAHPTPESFTNILGVVYLHQRTAAGGDLYLTRHGVAMQHLLQTDNWLEPAWFEAHRSRLEGTSTVYRVPTKVVNGESADLVVKYCRVGEDVPMNTHTMREFLNAEFNSPWEEFSLVMELHEGRHGPDDIRINAQQPLAIHVPPEPMQEWQTGRSLDRINRIISRHPGIGLDLLKQYQLIYGWIPGRNIVEALTDRGRSMGDISAFVWRMNDRVMADMRRKGFVVADMKPVHVILGNEALQELDRQDVLPETKIDSLLKHGRYAVIDYELLMRTPEYEAEVGDQRRHSYLDDQRDRFCPTELPSHLDQTEILGVPYVHGQVESTGGELWVVGRNARLFDYFLPERWRQRPGAPLTQNNDVNYTLTKDKVHLVWKVSRVGENPDAAAGGRAASFGFNSPFESCAVAMRLKAAGIPTTYMRAIYRTGSRKLEPSGDPRRYASHAHLCNLDDSPILSDRHNYILICGYYNGSDAWVAANPGRLCRPLNLTKAISLGVMDQRLAETLAERMRQRMAAAGCDGSCLSLGDLLCALDPDDQPVREADGAIEVRVCDFKLIAPLPEILQPGSPTPLHDCDNGWIRYPVTP